MSNNRNKIINTIKSYDVLCQRVKAYLEEHRGYLGKPMTNFDFALYVNKFGYLQINTNFLVTSPDSNDPDDKTLVSEIISEIDLQINDLGNKFTEEPKMADQKRWRGKEGETFYYLRITHKQMEVMSAWEEDDDMVYQYLFDTGNYFRNEVEAIAAGNELQKVLVRVSGKLNDYTWAYEQMKQGKKVRRRKWAENEYIYKGCLTIVGSDGMAALSFIDDIDGTDWEIYESC